MASTSFALVLSPTAYDFEIQDSVRITTQTPSNSIPQGHRITGGTITFDRISTYAREGRYTDNATYWRVYDDWGNMVAESDVMPAPVSYTSMTLSLSGTGTWQSPTMAISLKFFGGRGGNLFNLRQEGAMVTLYHEPASSGGGGGGGDWEDPPPNYTLIPGKLYLSQPNYSRKVHARWDAATWTGSGSPSHISYNLMDATHHYSFLEYSSELSTTFTPQAYGMKIDYQLYVDSVNAMEVSFASFTASKPKVQTAPTPSLAKAAGGKAQLSWTVGTYYYAEGVGSIRYRIYAGTTSRFADARQIFTTSKNLSVPSKGTTLSGTTGADTSLTLSASKLRAEGFSSGQTIYFFVQPYYTGEDANAKALNQNPTKSAAFLFREGSVVLYCPDGTSFYPANVYYCPDGERFYPCDVYQCFDGQSFILCSS